MIQLLPLLSLDGRFAAQDLPHELQLTLLNSIVVPRIVSSSMTPTIQAGDKLELSPPTSLAVGSIVVFRNDSLLICHRITAIDPQGALSTRGDATQSPCETVQPGSVIGVVTGVLRKGTYVSFGQGPPTSSASAQQNRLKSRVWAMAVRSVTRSIRALARFSIFQHILAFLLRSLLSSPLPFQCCLVHTPHVSSHCRTSHDIQQAKPARYVVRLGPWRVAQYDPTEASLLLRQSLREAGLEPFILTILR